ncbi:MAG: gamma carbonic anhydrase family protein [Myxococcota bacterium]
MAIYALGPDQPRLSETCWVAPDAAVIGRVVIGAHASVWWKSVLRGDNEPIELHERVNVQDGSILHTDPGCPLTLHEGVTVGHQCMLHGCTVGRFALIGIGSRILNRARIGPYCLVGAHTLVTEDKEIPEGSLVLGSPARVVRQLNQKERDLLEASARHYCENAKRYREKLRRL